MGAFGLGLVDILGVATPLASAFEPDHKELLHLEEEPREQLDAELDLEVNFGDVNHAADVNLLNIVGIVVEVGQSAHQHFIFLQLPSRRTVMVLHASLRVQAFQRDCYCSRP